MLAPQIIDLDRFGSITINDTAKTFHLELYDEKISGTFSKKRVQGKLIVDKTYYFHQLLDYKKNEDQQRHSTCTIGETNDYHLGIEIYLDDSSLNYIRMSFGCYSRMYTDGLYRKDISNGIDTLPEEYLQAQVQLGKLTAALEKIKQQKDLNIAPIAQQTEEKQTSPAQTTHLVILESVNPRTKLVKLTKLIKLKNPDLGFFKIQMLIGSKGQTIFTTNVLAEAEEYAALIASTGASVSVKNELLRYDSSSYRMNSNSFTSIKDSNLSETILPSISQASPASTSPLSLGGNTPQKKSPCGCFAIAFIIFFLIGIIANIGNITEKEREKQEPASAEHTPKKQDEPKISAAIENKPVVIQEEAKKIEPPVQPTKVEPVPAKQPESASKTEVKETKTSTSTTQPKPIIKAVIDPDALNILPTKKGQGYDKTIARYGVARIKKINKLLPIIAEKASTLKCMDYIYRVDVSDNMSTPDILVFYVDAENGMRVYINEFLEVVDMRQYNY